MFVGGGFVGSSKVCELVFYSEFCLWQVWLVGFRGCGYGP